MKDFIFLVFLIFSRPGSALVELMNRGLPLWLTALLVFLGASLPMLIFYWLTGLSFLKKRMYYPGKLIMKTQQLLKRKRFTENILLSFLSYRVYLKSRKQKAVRKIIYLIDKYGGYLVVFFASFFALPMMRVAAVITTRAISLKGGMYIIVGAAALRCWIDTWIYYRLGETLIPFHVLQFKTILLINLIIIVSGFFGGWLRHAIRDRHFFQGRFE